MDYLKKALVFYLYSNNNAGDMAICMGAIDLLKSAGFTVSFFSRYSSRDKEFQDSLSYVRSYHPDVKIEPGIFSFDRSSSFSAKLGTYAHGFARCVLPIRDKRLEKLIRESDVVFFNGGNLLRCDGFTDISRLCALFYPLEIAKKMGKPLVCLPQSTANVSRVGKAILGRCISLFDLVAIRESLSLRAIRDLYPNAFCIQSIDLAFFIDEKRCRETPFKQFRNRIALVLRESGIGDIGNLEEDRIGEMSKGILDFVRSHTDELFLIVVQTKKDRNYSQRILEKIDDDRVDIVEEHDPVRLIDLYRQCKALITMRLHAGILAIRAGTPVIGFFDSSWGLKNRGIMGDFQMGYAEDASDLENQYEKTLMKFSACDVEQRIARQKQELTRGIEAIDR